MVHNNHSKGRLRLNVKKDDTGKETIDWDHIDGVKHVDIQAGMLRYHKYGEGGSYDMHNIEYFHVYIPEDSE